MVDITLTEFVDFVSKAGTPKLTVVRRVKQRHAEPYDPQQDFYKAIRDGIVAMHKGGRPKSTLDGFLNGLTDKKKQTAYPDLVTGYKKFLGNKTIQWFNPTKTDWVHAGLSVSVNPEVGLDINGTRRLIKLYFKAEQLSKIRMDTITHLMAETLTCTPFAECCVLDVRNAKLMTEGNTDPGLTALLQGEAASFVQIYHSV